MMLTFFLILFLIFSAVISYLCLQFGREQKLFRKKIDLLKKGIAQSQRKSVMQGDKMQLSEALDKSLQVNNTALRHAIFNLQHDLFEILSKNKPLK